jgi:hypothetical protein
MTNNKLILVFSIFLGFIVVASILPFVGIIKYNGQNQGIVAEVKTTAEPINQPTKENKIEYQIIKNENGNYDNIFVGGKTESASEVKTSDRGFFLSESNCLQPKNHFENVVDNYYFPSLNVKVINTVEFKAELWGGYEFSPSYCVIHGKIVKAQIEIDGKKIDEAKIGNYSFYGNRLNIDILESFKNNGKIAVLYKIKSSDKAQYLGNKNQLKLSQTGGESWVSLDLEDLSKSYESTEAGAKRGNEEINIDDFKVGESQISDQEFQFYKYLSRYVYGTRTESVWSGDIKDFELNKEENSLSLWFTRSSIECLEKATKDVPNVIENTCGRELVFTKTSPGKWEFDLKKSIDKIQLPPEIAKYKTNWDPRALSIELSNKANQEEQRRFDILLNNLTTTTPDPKKESDPYKVIKIEAKSALNDGSNLYGQDQFLCFRRQNETRIYTKSTSAGLKNQEYIYPFKTSNTIDRQYDENGKLKSSHYYTTGDNQKMTEEQMKKFEENLDNGTYKCL